MTSNTFCSGGLSSKCLHMSVTLFLLHMTPYFFRCRFKSAVGDWLLIFYFDTGPFDVAMKIQTHPIITERGWVGGGGG